MVNYLEIVHLPEANENDESKDLAFPVQDDSQLSKPAKKIKITLLAKFMEKFLEFLPNKTTKRETTSVGVQNDASVAVVNRAVLEMSGSTSVKIIDGASLDMSGSSSIKTSGITSVKIIDGASLDMSGSSSIKMSERTSVKMINGANLDMSGSSSIKTTSEGKIEVIDSAKLDMSGSSSIKTSGITSVKMINGASLDMSGDSSIKTTSEGKIEVIDGAKLDMSGRSSIKMIEAASIDFGAATKLFARTGGAISGLQGTMLRDTLLSSARAYKIEAPMDITGSIATEIVNSFSLGDIFYFVANEALVGDVGLSYSDINGNTATENINQENSVTLMLAGKTANGLLFKKLSETENRAIRELIAQAFESVEEIEVKLNAHIEDSQKHLEPGDRERWDNKASKEELLEVKELVSYTNAQLDYHIEDTERHVNYGERERWDSKASKEELANEAQKIEDIKSDVQKLLPWGTDNQVMLGSGKKTLDSTTHDAASSLFATASVLGKDVDYIYCQKGDRSIRVSWGDFVEAVGREFNNAGIIPNPPAVYEIKSASLSIDTPINGTNPNTEITINDNAPNFTASGILWEPLGIVNSTQTYTASFSIFPNYSAEAPYAFAQNADIKVNGASPASISRETNGALNIAVVFPPTMTALPTPSLSIAEPEYGATRPPNAAQNDAGASNYDNSIIWTPPGATFPGGVSTGDFSLIAKPGYRWNADDALLNNNAVPGNDRALSADGMRLNIMHRTASLIDPDIHTFTDPRDGQEYEYRQMPDGKYWMTENLDYAGNDGVYYGNAASPPFAKAGRLYTWDQAKAAAPAGWHLASNEEWSALAIAAGGTGILGDGGNAGTKLKTNHTWRLYSGIPTGTDNYGFSALPGGFKRVDGSFDYINYYGYWWTSTESTSISSAAISRYLAYASEESLRDIISKAFRISVRCVKD